ncbi:hypothetical protein K8T06_06795 [bacterium]|nr:hypothetical protein [bacterium]
MRMLAVTSMQPDLWHLCVDKQVLEDSVVFRDPASSIPVKFRIRIDDLILRYPKNVAKQVNNNNFMSAEFGARKHRILICNPSSFM